MDIVKGESYIVSFVLKANGSPVTSNDVDAVRISLGNQVAYYPDGTLDYNAESQTWEFPMSQKNTYSIIGQTVEYQAQVKINGEVFSHKKREIKVEETMFTKEW